jgi:ribosomal protein S20
MARNYTLQVKLDQNQRERVRNNASAKGYKTVAGYVRDLILEKNLYYEKKFNEMYEEIMKIARKRQN